MCGRLCSITSTHFVWSSTTISCPRFWPASTRRLVEYSFGLRDNTTIFMGMYRNVKLQLINSSQELIALPARDLDLRVVTHHGIAAVGLQHAHNVVQVDEVLVVDTEKILFRQQVLVVFHGIGYQDAAPVGKHELGVAALRLQPHDILNEDDLVGIPAGYGDLLVLVVLLPDVLQQELE